jgi:hypothetical protein
MIARGGTDGCARSSEDNGERRHQHAVRAQKSFSGFLGHWQSTRFGFRFRYYASSLIPNWSPASLEAGTSASEFANRQIKITLIMTQRHFILKNQGFPVSSVQG